MYPQQVGIIHTQGPIRRCNFNRRGFRQKARFHVHQPPSHFLFSYKRLVVDPLLVVIVAGQKQAAIVVVG